MRFHKGIKIVSFTLFRFFPGDLFCLALNESSLLADKKIRRIYLEIR